MSKEIVVQEVKVFREFRMPTALFRVLLKKFATVDIEAFMDAEHVFNVMAADSSDIKLIFVNIDVKNLLFSQLSANNKILFEKLEKKHILVEK